MMDVINFCPLVKFGHAIHVGTQQIINGVIYYVVWHNKLIIHCSTRHYIGLKYSSQFESNTYSFSRKCPGRFVHLWVLGEHTCTFVHYSVFYHCLLNREKPTFLLCLFTYVYLLVMTITMSSTWMFVMLRPIWNTYMLL